VIKLRCTRYAFVLVTLFLTVRVEPLTQIIKLEIPDEYFKVVEEFARQQGLNPNAILNSVVKF